MKRLRFGLALLVLLLAAGIALSDTMERTNRQCGRLLDAAATVALEEQWELALEFAEDARDLWQKNWAVTAALADHQPMDEIDGFFAELERYGQCRDRVSFCGAAAHLGSLLTALSRSHRLTVWNFLACPPIGRGWLPPMPRWR